MKVEPAAVLEFKPCAACSIAGACLVDGPIPDFELAAVGGLLGLAP